MPDRLELALSDLGEHLAFPDVPDVAHVVLARLGGRAPRRSWRRIAIAVASVAVGVLAFPGPRTALAEWIGIRTVRIVPTTEVPQNVGSTLQLGREVSLEEAGRVTVLAAPPELGTPARAYTGEPTTGSVTLVWAATDSLPAIGDTGVGLLLTRIPASVERAVLEKRVGPLATSDVVRVLDSQAYWIEGAHELVYLDENGALVNDRTRTATNALLWTVDGVTYRMESNLSQPSAIALASTLAELR